VSALLSFVCLSTASGAGPHDLYPPDIKQIKERGKLIVAQYRGVQPGFFALGNVETGGDLQGCDIVLAERIAMSLGVALELDRTAADFDSVCRSVAAGRADLGISKLSATLPRAQYLRFSKPYASLRTGILIDRVFFAKARPSGSIQEVCNRQGTRIGVWGGCAYARFARSLFPKAVFVEYPEYEPMLQGLLRGEVHAVYDEELALHITLNQNPKLALRFRLVAIPGIEDRITVAVRYDSPNLLAYVNLLLEQEEVKDLIKRSLESAFRTGANQAAQDNR